MILLFLFIGYFVLLKIIVCLRDESQNLDKDNPYLDSSFSAVLPENMRHFTEHMPSKPDRSIGIYERIIKTVLDNVLSFFGLVILSPVFLIIMALIKVDDPGPIFFTQKRIGKDKQFFTLHKFRSMKMSTPHDVPTHELENPDQYITKIGRFLRKSSLDELPQIWEIFRGKMSIIGPRPALWNQADLVYEREKYAANDALPGLTGWAQINGRDELEIPMKAKLDGEYCERISFRFDAKCFIGTLLAVVRRDGVVEGGTGEMHKRDKQ